MEYLVANMFGQTYMHVIHKNLRMYATMLVQRVILALLTGSRICVSRQPVSRLLRGHTNFANESAFLMADIVRNEGK
jgi:hypothetical protein